MVFKVLGNDIGRLMQQCFPRGIPADARIFILIGNVLPSRTLTDVEVQPSTRMTRCFEDGFGHLSLPPLPANIGQKGLALFIPMKISP
jgi:hypothetical protein